MPDPNALDGDLTGTYRLTELPPSAIPALRSAEQVLEETLLTVAGVIRDARRIGRLRAGPLLGCARRIVAHVVRRPDAMLWRIRTDQRGSYLYRRAVGSAVMGAVLGRQLGLDTPALETVATGMLLLDIGKVAVPVPILAKPDALDAAEHAYVRRHVERGLELVVAAGDVPARAIEMIAGHHERIDGSGYPAGIVGTRIPVFARIAALADTFDALTLNRRYAAAMSPHAALRLLDSLRNEKFDGALVGELVHALGAWPTGTWVELLDGSIGVVCAQQAADPLRPHILVALDAQRKPLSTPYVVQPAGGAEIVGAMPPNVAFPDVRQLEEPLAPLFAA